MVVSGVLPIRDKVSIRRAVEADRDTLLALHERALRALAVGHYHVEQIEALMAAGTLDAALVEDGTYFVALLNDTVVGCGGWSVRPPGYLAGMHKDPNQNVLRQAQLPRLRAMFVDPAWTRRGVARRLVRHIETDVLAAGYAQLSLDALLSGVALYHALGYRTVAHGMTRLLGDVALRFLHMSKWLDVATAAHA